ISTGVIAAAGSRNDRCGKARVTTQPIAAAWTAADTATPSGSFRMAIRPTVVVVALPLTSPTIIVPTTEKGTSSASPRRSSEGGRAAYTVRCAQRGRPRAFVLRQVPVEPGARAISGPGAGRRPHPRRPQPPGDGADRDRQDADGEGGAARGA